MLVPSHLGHVKGHAGGIKARRHQALDVVSKTRKNFKL